MPPQAEVVQEEEPEVVDPVPAVTVSVKFCNAVCIDDGWQMRDWEGQDDSELIAEQDANRSSVMDTAHTECPELTHNTFPFCCMQQLLDTVSQANLSFEQRAQVGVGRTG